MCHAYKRKIGDEGELVDGTQSGKGTIFPVQQFYRLPSCYSPNRFPQAYVIVVPLPCYLPACNSPEDTHGSNGTIGMKGTASYKELKSLFDEPTMPSWEEFVSGLDAQAPPSSEECASDFEEMVNKGTKLAREIIMDPCEGSLSALQPNGIVLEANVKELTLAEKMKELKTKVEEMAVITESLSNLESKEIDFEVNANNLEGNTTELETKAEEMAAMPMLSLVLPQTEDTGLEGSTLSWLEEEEPPIENTEESDEIFQRNNEESPPVIEQEGLSSERFV